MNWRLYVARQAILVRLPFGDRLRRWKRQLFGYAPDTGNLRNTLASLAEMRAALDEQGVKLDGATVLEIGSGWFPTIPILLATGGARQVLMSDLNPHMDAVTFAATLDFLRREQPGNQALAAVRTIDDLPIRYLAPFDVGMIPDGSLDVVMSRTVLEHIPPADIERLFAALRPKMSPHGVMVHLIDHSDHMEHRDRSISKIHFLTWPDRLHTWINRLTREGENRLRHGQYAEVFRRAGYAVLAETRTVHAPTAARVPALALVAPFSTMPAEELATLSSVYVLRPDR